MNDIRENKPFKTNQIKNEKPSIQKTESILTGYIANSFNGGHNKTIAYKQVMAGEKIKEYTLQANFQMLTPITPTYQNLIMTIRTYFVPNSRVWKNAEKYLAQKGGSAETKINEIPNTGGKAIPLISGLDYQAQEKYTLLSNTDLWRDSFISSYIPRTEYAYQAIQNEPKILPKLSILPLRGRVAIYNDLERNKEYEEKVTEFNDDTVSTEEWNSYLPLIQENIDYYTMRSKRNNSYYTNYRTEVQGFESEYPPGEMTSDKSLITWASWEAKIAEARSEAENAQATDWDIIAKIRGSKKLTEGKVQLIGETSFPLNYSAITQNTYNNNENIREEFRVLGKQGAYSYTQINKSIFAGFESVEEGYIHIIATVSADTVFENAFDRLELNVTPFTQYRPDLKDDKYDFLYEIESDADAEETAIKGFKRKYTEYFKLPNIISGDMHNSGFYETSLVENDEDGIKWQTGSEIISNSTYQFFETSDRIFYDVYTYLGNIYTNGIYVKIWKDYTDLQINKNQAIKNQIEEYEDKNIRVKGQNQIFFVGKCICIADLPIDEEIKNNYTQWGEH